MNISEYESTPPKSPQDLSKSRSDRLEMELFYLEVNFYSICQCSMCFFLCISMCVCILYYLCEYVCLCVCVCTCRSSESTQSTVIGSHVSRPNTTTFREPWATTSCLRIDRLGTLHLALAVCVCARALRSGPTTCTWLTTPAHTHVCGVDVV